MTRCCVADVRMYLEDSRPMIHALFTLVGRGGVVSVLTENAALVPSARPSKARGAPFSPEERARAASSRV